MGVMTASKLTTQEALTRRDCSGCGCRSGFL
jgi:hypothetical protein